MERAIKPAPCLLRVQCIPSDEVTENATLLKRYKDKKVDRDWLNTNFPCMMACPAHTNAGRYVALIAEGRFEEAYKFARDPNPLASICCGFALIPAKLPVVVGISIVPSQFARSSVF